MSSSVLAAQAVPAGEGRPIAPETSTLSSIVVGDHLVQTGTDLVALMAYVERQPAQLSLTAIAPIIRAASPTALNVPSAYDAAILHLRAIFPDEPRPGTYDGHDRSALRDLLALRIPHTVRPLTYAQLHTHDASERVLEALLARFTPALFTMPAARHMRCTNLIVHAWDERVLQPALAVNGAGLSAPLETLERVKGLPWTELGVCAPCIDALKDEWTGIQRELWEILGRTIEEENVNA